MLARTTLALLLLLPAATAAQEVDTALFAVVRISGTRGGTPVRGSGFVVGLDRDQATIVTASHVIEGVQQLEVTFTAHLAESFPAGAVLGMDAGSPNGLAAFQVRGALPAGVTALSFETGSQPRVGEALFLLGFPQMSPVPRTAQRVLSARSGALLLIDQGIGEGFSGGPVLQGGKVVGVITEMDEQTTYAVIALEARKALEDWGARLGLAAPEVTACVPGEERTENGIVFVRICPGTFTMGSARNDSQANPDEKPAHQVTLSEFWIGKTEITNEQYRRVHPEHQGEASLPVIEVSWADAKAACEHLGGRLPTEAEWEYAARAGSQTAWSSGDDEKRLGEYAWYRDTAGDTLHPVGTKKANAWGLHDMHGNAREWVADWYGEYSGAAQTDPSGPATGTLRVLRGGSFSDPPGFLRSADRLRFQFELGHRIKGFRCARAPRRLAP